MLRLHGIVTRGPTFLPFVLLGSETSVSLRVLVDRSTVEVFAAAGRSVVSVRDFPLEHETGVRIGNTKANTNSSSNALGSIGALVVTSAKGWSMGCGWTSSVLQN